MSNYKITKYSFEQAEKLGVQIKPSKNPKKKIDVYKNNKLISSIGARGFMDYPNYLKIDKEKAETKRKNYKARHQADRTKPNTPGYFADKILW